MFCGMFCAVAPSATQAMRLYSLVAELACLAVFFVPRRRPCSASAVCTHCDATATSCLSHTPHHTYHIRSIQATPTAATALLRNISISTRPVIHTTITKHLQQHQHHPAHHGCVISVSHILWSGSLPDTGASLPLPAGFLDTVRDLGRNDIRDTTRRTM